MKLSGNEIGTMKVESIFRSGMRTREALFICLKAVNVGGQSFSIFVPKGFRRDGGMACHGKVFEGSGVLTLLRMDRKRKT